MQKKVARKGIAKNSTKGKNMSITNKKDTADLTQGNLLKQILLFTLPIIATGVLQLLFNTADLIVVKTASDTAGGAVSATNALNNLIVNLIMGISVGAGVLTAKYFGANDEKNLHEVVHTSFPTALIGGVLFGAIGFVLARPLLELFDTPANMIDQSTTYIRIIFCGAPFNVVYNFGASILRSVGNTRKPLMYLIIAGVANVLLNMFFVFVCGLDVEGVALATIISQLISAVLVVCELTRAKGPHRLNLREIRIYPAQLGKMIYIGLPAGVQGAMFSISNVIIQSSVNGFGELVVTANGAANNIEGYVYTCMNSFHQTAVAFVGQHIGAKKHKRILNICLCCVGCVTAIGFVLGVGAYLLGEPLLRILINKNIVEDSLHFGILRLSIIGTTYFLCGLMDVMCGILRGMGKSTQPMIITILSVCGVRILWIYTVFEKYKTLETLYLSYPISWALCVTIETIFFVFAYQKMIKTIDATQQPLQNEIAN